MKIGIAEKKADLARARELRTGNPLALPVPRKGKQRSEGGPLPCEGGVCLRAVASILRQGSTCQSVAGGLILMQRVFMVHRWSTYGPDLGQKRPTAAVKAEVILREAFLVLREARVPMVFVNSF